MADNTDNAPMASSSTPFDANANANADADASTAPKVRPGGAFLLSHPAHFIALGAGSGLSPKAPGTVGTLWAWLTFAVMAPWLNDAAWAAVIVVSTLVGWWACTVTARHMKVPDSGHIVWDEVVAFWLVLWLVTPADWMSQLLAFGLFRLFDAVKVGPMAWADQHFKGFGPRGGFGIMLDDFAAALCTLLVIAAWRFWSA